MEARSRGEPNPLAEPLDGIFNTEKGALAPLAVLTGKQKIMAGFGAAAVVALSITLIVTSTSPSVKHVAFIGNSLVYFYDLPRSFEKVSRGHARQSSVLAGAGSLSSMFDRQNGMWNRWRTDSAILSDGGNDDITPETETVWDFGSCSVEMLFNGHDATEAQSYYDEWWDYRETYGLQDDDGWAYGSSQNSDYRMNQPCAQSQAYLDYLAALPQDDIRINPKRWDYVVIADKSKGPKTEEGREDGLAALQYQYLPLFQESGATPVFLVTQAYWVNRNTDDDGNSNTYDNVPYHTAQTYEGYKQWAEFMADALPRKQRPKLINLGIAYLTVYEEDPDLWNDLFWVDYKHQSPHGSFLQTCLLHYVVFGRPPKRSHVIRKNMTTLWDGTRTLMYPRDDVVDFPTTDEAKYLYDVCKRVAGGYIPPTFQEQLDENGLSLYQY